MKGQYFSFDAIIAAVIFVLALMALLSYWYAVKNYLDSQNDELEKEAIRISNLLLSPPYPAGSCAGMETLGLSMSWTDKRVDQGMLDCTNFADGEWVKERLATPFDVSINVIRLPDMRTWRVGEEPGVTTSEVVKMHRFATLVDDVDGSTQLAVIELKVYR